MENFSSLPAAIQFSFAPITRTTGNEATHSQSMLDIVVPIVLSISPSTAVLPADTIVIISIQSGSAKCMFHLLHLHVYMYMPYTSQICCYPSLTVGRDFTLSRTEVTFALGTNDGNVISVLDDPLVEGTESFTLTGSVAPPAWSSHCYHH